MCHLAREFKTNLVASMAVAHEVLAQLAIGQHDIAEVERSCGISHCQRSVPNIQHSSHSDRTAVRIAEHLSICFGAAKCILTGLC